MLLFSFLLSQENEVESQDPEHTEASRNSCSQEMYNNLETLGEAHMACMVIGQELRQTPELPLCSQDSVVAHDMYAMLCESLPTSPALLCVVFGLGF